MKIWKWNLLIIWMLIILFGILAVYSVSIQESFSLTLSQWDPSNYFYFFRQLRNLWIAVILWIIIYKTPLERFKKYYKWIFLLAIVIQLLVLSPLGATYNGSRNWLNLPFLWNIQPSEFFKIWFAIFIAGWLNERKNILSTQKWILWYIILIWLSAILFLVIKDNGTILVMGTLALIVYRYAGGSGRVVWLFILLWSVFGLVVVTQFSYVQDRIQTFLHPESDTNKEWKWRQIAQSLIAIWWWWLTWRWYGKWIQKFNIPEAQSDFIFAAFSEEVWFVGNIFLIFLFWSIVYSYLSTAWNIKDNYFKILGGAMLSTIIIQTFINIWVNTNLIPNTWLTLPFISVWWSGIMANTIQLMILHKIKKNYSN